MDNQNNNYSSVLRFRHDKGQQWLLKDDAAKQLGIFFFHIIISCSP